MPFYISATGSTAGPSLTIDFGVSLEFEYGKGNVDPGSCLHPYLWYHQIGDSEQNQKIGDPVNVKY
jgi:hypothetical protein